MKKNLIGISFAIAVAMTASHALAGEAAKSDEIKFTTIPEHKIPEPEARGKPFKVPPTNWEKRPVLWGWSCELPDGSGFSFGGVDQLGDEGNPHTSVKEGGQWKPLIEDLRKNNPLQKQFKTIRGLRDACKDALARARNIYFEGRTADEEAKLIKTDVDPAIDKLSADLAAFATEAKSIKGDYESGQAQFALKHIEAAASIKPFGAKVTPEQMATMRKAQIELEIAGEAFDAEPPPRALSLMAYDSKTKLYVIFGGAHMDYETNDLWVFDPAKKKWMQRHPESSPEARFDHRMEPLGDGRIAMRGGCIYENGKGYIHVGPERWIYDVEKNVWSADGHALKTVASDSRSVRYFPPAGPEAFMKGQPDAAANEAVLKALPVNTFVRLKTPIPLGGRDWGTWAFDADRDMFYVYSGGHASYPGNDVARFHLASGRWEISDPVELPLGCCGTNEQYPSGFNFNLRPWCKKHVWNGQAYDSAQKKMILGSVNDGKLDRYCYFYDPDKADWGSRHAVPPAMGNDGYGIQLRNTKHGMFSWYGDEAWQLDEKTLEWKKLAVQGKMPGTGVDSCGMVYDPKRDRMLFATLGGYAKPFDGQIYALDFATLKVAPLNPEGLNQFKSWNLFCREVAYDPEHDLFLWSNRLNVENKRSTDQFPAYDAEKNRWVTIKLAVSTPEVAFDNSLVCTSISFDPKRGLFWVGDASWNGGVWALKLDVAKTEVKALKEYVPVVAATVGEKK